MKFPARQDFREDVELIFSTADDGSMTAGGGQATSSDHAANVTTFLKQHGFPLERSRVFVTYGVERTYVDIARVDQSNVGQEILADALYTTEPGRVITLPVADCIATVVYDPVTGMLGVLHLGRHSSVAGLIEHFVIEVADTIGSDPRDWCVWMSPSLRQAHDRMEYFAPADEDEWRDFVDTRADGIYIDVVGHNRARLERAGVSPGNIIISPIDTYTDERFFSHRAARELGQPSRRGRMMVAVQAIRQR